ncbi:11254_t:CDS:2 [Funneliformis mosseae]|uniref:11254_t:CDS:1 n=1 Tax=Funneliformis mosseae TaxID=27381 RepID=A0A9N9H747_FUNMO|nr:11254_t:CDS:2 [Funneliformis mosseae]
MLREVIKDKIDVPDNFKAKNFKLWKVNVPINSPYLNDPSVDISNVLDGELDMMNEKIEDLRKDKSVIQILSVKEEEYLAKYTELDYKLTTLEIELPGLDILD